MWTGFPKKRELIPLKKGHPTQNIRTFESRKTIRTIFENYPMCVTHLYNSDWVFETIINDRIQIPPSKEAPELTDKLKQDKKWFLQISPSFFKYFLTHEPIHGIALEWFCHVYARMYPSHLDYTTLINSYRNEGAPLPFTIFHELIPVCIFIDKLNEEDTQEARE